MIRPYTVIGIYTDWGAGETYHDNAWVEHVNVDLPDFETATGFPTAPIEYVKEAVRIAVREDCRDRGQVVDVFLGHAHGQLPREALRDLMDEQPECRFCLNPAPDGGYNGFCPECADRMETHEEAVKNGDFSEHETPDILCPTCVGGLTIDG